MAYGQCQMSRGTSQVLARPPHEVLPQRQFCRANTVLQWLVEAAEQLHAFSRYFLCDVHVQQRQLDALYAVLRERKAGESPWHLCRTRHNHGRGAPAPAHQG